MVAEANQKASAAGEAQSVQADQRPDTGAGQQSAAPAAEERSAPALGEPQVSEDESLTTSPFAPSAPTASDRVGGEYGRPPAVPFTASGPAFGSGAGSEPGPVQSDADVTMQQGAEWQSAPESSDPQGGDQETPTAGSFTTSASATGGEYRRPPAAPPLNASSAAFNPGGRPVHSNADAIAARAVAQQDAELQAVARSMGFADGGAPQ